MDGPDTTGASRLDGKLHLHGFQHDQDLARLHMGTVQPSIIKDIDRVICWLRDRGDMAIVLVEQYFEFARDLADLYAVMDQGEAALRVAD